MSHPHTVILVGAGHAHLHVAAHAEMLIERGARVVLVDPDKFWYSGLATGMLGGAYEPAEDQVDPRALIQAHGGESIQGWVETIQPGARRLRLASGRDLAYDYLSINVGSRVNVDAIPGAAHDRSVWSVKPVSNLWKLREHLESRFRAGEAPHVAVVSARPPTSSPTCWPAWKENQWPNTNPRGDISPFSTSGTAPRCRCGGRFGGMVVPACY